VHVSAKSQVPVDARQAVPAPASASAGHVVATPSQVSVTSHAPTAARHTVPAPAGAQLHTPPLQLSAVHALPSSQSAADVHAAQVPFLQKPLHASPHALQLVRVPSVVSQPLDACVSQSPKPELQLEIPQLPLLQLGVACVTEQIAPHAPQFCSVCRLVSQPACAELQSA
jgi:hypothetical protein